MERYITVEQLPEWDAVAVNLHIEDTSSCTYYTMRRDLKPGIDLIASADADNSGWSRWGSLIVEEILPDGIMTSQGELVPGKNIFTTYSNVYPYCDGELEALLLNMNLKVTVEDPDDGKKYTALVPRVRYYQDVRFLEPLIKLAKEYFPEAKGYLSFLESLRPTPKNSPIVWDITVYKDTTCKIKASKGLFPANCTVPAHAPKDGVQYKVINVDGGGSLRSGELQNLVIPNGIECIDSFTNCKQLTQVQLPSTLKEFGYESFKGCSNLEHIEIPDGVISIGYAAFAETAIREIHLPAGLKKLYTEALAGTKLRKIIVPENIDQIWNGCFRDCLELEEALLPEAVLSIERYAFKGCVKLRKINIPDNVRYIGIEAFAGCSSLQEISVPEFAIIDTDAFKDCPCTITYRKTKEIRSWQKVNVVRRTKFDDGSNLDFKYNKSYRNLVADPEYNKVCDSSQGFYEIEVSAFNEKFVRLQINGWDYVLAAGEKMLKSPNSYKDMIITVL